jgi:hypothetical protein
VSPHGACERITSFSAPWEVEQLYRVVLAAFTYQILRASGKLMIIFIAILSIVPR